MDSHCLTKNTNFWKNFIIGTIVDSDEINNNNVYTLNSKIFKYHFPLLV